MVLPDSDRVPRVPSYSGIIPGWSGFRLRGCHPLWPAFPGRSTTQTLVPRCDCRRNWMTLQPHSYNAGRLAYEWFGLVPVRSPLLGESRLIYFPEGTEMFQFPSFATSGLCIQPEATLTFLSVGFPIRRSTDQRLLTAPRGLSQFCHVLHRLLVPRHPPNALNSLTTMNWCTPEALSSSSSAPAQCQVVSGHSCLRIFVRHQSITFFDRSRRRSPDVVSCARFHCCLTRNTGLERISTIFNCACSCFVHLFSCQRGPAVLLVSGPRKT